MAIKLRIKDILKEKGISSKELAISLGKAPQYVSNIINGGKGASLSTLNEISEALGVGMGELFAPVVATPSTTGFVALIKNGSDMYSAASVQEAMDILKRIEETQQNSPNDTSQHGNRTDL